MSSGIPSRGLLNAANIPADLQKKIGQGIEPYSIIPLLDGEVGGSGTLVTIDGIRGILTAGHVVRNWQNRNPRAHAPKRLGIVPDRCASTLVEEPLEHFDSYVIGPGISEDLGPDLAFVRIPSPSGFLSTLIAKKSFFDLSGPSVNNRLIGITRKTPLALCGIVAARTEVTARKVILNHYLIFGTEPEQFERDGFDYIDLGSRRSLEPRTPISFGGMSGAGLWRFSIGRLPGSEMKPFDFQLAGVAFYQLADTADGIATVRFHGPRSVYERLLPQARNWTT